LRRRLRALPAGQRDLLIRLMEGIEDIPNIVLTEGLPWNWETFPEYFDSLAERRYDIDIAGTCRMRRCASM